MATDADPPREAHEGARSVADRLTAITDRLASEGRVEVADLARRLEVAPETIRRDLRALETEQKLQRVHGGAVPVPQRPPTQLSLPRLLDDDAALARRVWAALPRSGSILLDAGRLSAAVAEMMVVDPPERTGLTVVTNSLDVAIVLSRIHTLSVFNLGGSVTPRTRAQEGDWALAALARLHTDISVLCPAGISVAGGLTENTPAAAAVSRAQVAAAKRVVVLADAETLGRSALVSFAPIGVVETLFTTCQPDAAARRPYLERGIRLQPPEPEADERPGAAG